MYFRYFRYVVKHKWYVFQACRKLGVPWLGVLHDLSKLWPDEFVPYARYFYGRPPGGSPARDAIRERMQGNFDRAWLLHIHRNKHHPQFWVLRNDTDGVVFLEMPEKYVREMVADWIGAGMAIHGYGWEDAPEKTRSWWSFNNDKSGYRMHDRTRALINHLIRNLP
jgi:hypothetical protein